MVKGKKLLKKKSQKSTKSRVGSSKTSRVGSSKISQSSSNNTRPNSAKPRRKTLAQKTIIVVIALACVAVAAFTICALVFDTKYQVEHEIGKMVSSYYENYFYPGVFSGNINMAEVMAQFEEDGFAPVTMRQLILNTGMSSPEANWLRSYCDEEQTRVIYYPEAPYEASSYRTEITYSCNF